MAKKISTILSVDYKICQIFSRPHQVGFAFRKQPILIGRGDGDETRDGDESAM